jgi:hypothetical protein
VSWFTRTHDDPLLDDYLTMRSTSDELAWLSTEGRTFNHVAARVDDLDAIVEHERHSGRPIKDTAEVSASGRIRQTAHRAQPVERRFRDHAGAVTNRTVPGSFFEFIERRPIPGSTDLDLGFDAANAVGIFAMTNAGNVPAARTLATSPMSPTTENQSAD